MDAPTPRSILAQDAFRRAAEILGQSTIAELVPCTQSAVSKRLAKGELIWGEAVLRVEAALREAGVSDLTRHDLRPDLYPRETPAPAAAGARPPSAGGSSALEGVRP